MTSSSSPRLAAADRLLLRHVFAWSRANGWRRGGVPNYHWWLDPDGREVVWSYDADDRDAWTLVTNVIPAEACVDSVAQAVDVLVALGILPAHFSSAFAAGRESVWAEAETEYRVCRTYPTASGKLCIDQFVTLEDARDAADHYAASDLTGSNHWVERTEMVEREVPL